VLSSALTASPPAICGKRRWQLRIQQFHETLPG